MCKRPHAFDFFEEFLVSPKPSASPTNESAMPLVVNIYVLLCSGGKIETVVLPAVSESDRDKVGLLRKAMTS